ncbi:hypothetical protein PYW07_013753 [Mythimna separata]|uniref:N-acetyltransferase domain-containing protein n=1 Tax=Mythimna separata TaxID=271217 RepID=A0AAD7YF68_MYTSE|nr:hypothetical protein PYW07_013753 [Mythimna separata]
MAWNTTKDGVDKDPLAAEEMLELCGDAALDGLSLVAVATDTGEVVATVFCKLQEKPTPDSTEKSFLEIFAEERCKSPVSRFMMEFMMELDEKCNYFERCGVDCCCEIMFIGTIPHHRRKGLATLLVKTAVELIKNFKNGPIAPLTIKDLGPDYAFMKPTKPVTKAPQICTALWSAVGKYRVESLSAATMPGALKLMMEHFFQDEPVCNGTEVNKNPLAGEELLELCADAALDGLSLVAIDDSSGEVVSVVFNKLQEVPLGSEKTFFEIFSEERCKQPSSRALVDLMVRLDTQCDYAKRYGVDCWNELMFLGTHRQHRGKGLAKLLCKTSLEAAKKFKDGPFAP